MNKWTGIGRLTRDPELRYSQSGVAVTSFTVAVDRRFKNAQGEKETDFIRVKAFKKLAELCSEYLAKGKLAGVTGALQISNYTDRDGNKQWATDIIADEVEFLSPKSEGAQQTQGASQQPQTQGYPGQYGQPPGQSPYPGQYAPPGYVPPPQGPGHPNMPNPNMPPPPSYQGQQSYTGAPPSNGQGSGQSPASQFGHQVNFNDDDIPF
jgi:single-strand DNA-binding protein